MNDEMQQRVLLLNGVCGMKGEQKIQHLWQMASLILHVASKKNSESRVWDV